MKRMMRIALAAGCLGLLLCGCPVATVTHTPPLADQTPALGTEYPETVVANLEGSIDSYLLFNCLPILTGNANRPNSETYDVFTNQATLTAARNMLDGYGRLLGADRVVVRSQRERSSGWMTLWLVWHRIVTISGEALESKEQAK